MPAITFLAMWLYASYKHRLIDLRLPPHFINHLIRQYAASSIIYSAALIAAYGNDQIGLGIGISLTMLYLLPFKNPLITNADEHSSQT